MTTEKSYKRKKNNNNLIRCKLWGLRNKNSMNVIRAHTIFYSMSWPVGQILLYLSISRASTNHSIYTFYSIVRFSFTLRISIFFFCIAVSLYLCFAILCDFTVSVDVSVHVFFLFLAVSVTQSFGFCCYCCCILVCERASERVCVWVCVANTMFYIKIVEMTMISAHHTTILDFALAQQHSTNIGSFLSLPFVCRSFVSSFIAIYLHAMILLLIMFANAPLRSYTQHSISICFRFLLLWTVFAPINNYTFTVLIL